MAEKLLVGAVAARIGITRQAVLAAIHAGRLPAQRIPSGSGVRSVWVVNAADADRLWSKKLIGA